MLIANRCTLFIVMMTQNQGPGAPSLPQTPLWWVATFVVISRIMVLFDARSDSLWLKAELATSSLFIMNSSLHQVERSATIFFSTYKKLYIFNVYNLMRMEISIRVPNAILLILTSSASSP